MKAIVVLVVLLVLLFLPVLLGTTVPLQYNVRSLWVRKVTTVATALGIALVVFVFAGSLMLGEGVKSVLTAAGRPDTVVVLRKGSDAELSSAIGNEYLGLFRGPAQVSQAGGLVGEIVVIVTGDRSDGSGVSNVLVRGTPPEGYAFRPEIKLTRGRLPKPGTSEAIVGKGISGRFKGIAVGESFDLRRNRPLEIVGEFTADGSSYESEVWGDLDVIRRSLGRESAVSSVRVRLNSPSDFDAYRQTIESDKRFSMKVMREADYYQKQSEALAGFLNGMGLTAAILFSLAAMIGAAITMNGAVAHRTREIGTMRALGFSRFSVWLSFLTEAVALSVAGGLIGLAAVQLLSLVKVPIINFQTFSEIVLKFQVTPGVLTAALVFSGVMGVIGGLFPAIRASRVSPVEAMRG